MFDSSHLLHKLKEPATVLILIVSLLAGGFFLVGAIAYWRYCMADTKIWIFLLLSIPCFYLLSSVAMPNGAWLKALWVLIVLPSSIVHNASWWCFSQLTSKSGQTISPDAFELGVSRLLAKANLALSGCLIFISLLIVAKILDNSSVVKNIKERPFWTVCLFLMMFIYITYSLAFCLALHDRGARLMGQMPSLTMDGPEVVAPSWRGPDGHKVFDEWCFSNNGKAVDYLVYFARGKNDLIFDRKLLADLELSGSSEIDCSSKDIALKNSCALYEIQKVLICQDPEHPIQFLAESRAGDSVMLADARVDTTKRAVYRRMVEIKRAKAYSWPEILWIEAQVLGTEQKSDSQTFQDPVLSLKMGPITSSRWLTKPRIPSLLDYIYFTVYTITTTGYGDIKPTDDFSKFVTTIANIYELFFIVIVFNVLLSVRRDQAATISPATDKDA